MLINQCIRQLNTIVWAWHKSPQARWVRGNSDKSSSKDEACPTRVVPFPLLTPQSTILNPQSLSLSSLLCDTNEKFPCGTAHNFVLHTFPRTRISTLQLTAIAICVCVEYLGKVIETFAQNFGVQHENFGWDYLTWLVANGPSSWLSFILIRLPCVPDDIEKVS